VSVSKEYYSGWVFAYLGRATRWVRAATSFMLLEVLDVPIYLDRGEAPCATLHINDLKIDEP